MCYGHIFCYVIVRLLPLRTFCWHGTSKQMVSCLERMPPFNEVWFNWNPDKTLQTKIGWLVVNVGKAILVTVWVMFEGGWDGRQTILDSETWWHGKRRTPQKCEGPFSALGLLRSEYFLRSATTFWVITKCKVVVLKEVSLWARLWLIALNSMPDENGFFFLRVTTRLSKNVG